MSEIKNIHLVVAYFEDEDAAKDGLRELKKAHKKDELPMDGAAVVHRDGEGKIHLKEVGDTQAKEGAGVGALIGGALGALFGPLGLIGGGAIGAYYGSIVAATIDEGIPNAALEEIGEMMPRDASALVVLTSEEKAKDVEAELEKLGGQVVTEGGETAQFVVPDEVVQQEAQADKEAAGDESDTGETAD